MKTFKLILLFIFIPVLLCGAVSVTGVSGTISHGETITISGSGFGTKSSASPTLWDDCSGTNILTLWSNYWHGPTGYSDGGSSFPLAYRTPAQAGRSVTLPHSHITKYMCGAQDVFISEDGNDLCPWLYTASIPSAPFYTYVTWYRRLDPLWDWGSGDHNFKDFAWSDSDLTPFAGNSDYVSHYEPSAPYYQGTYRVHAAPTSPVGTPIAPEILEQGWVKMEWEAKWSTGSDGYHKIWENGVLKTHEAGVTGGFHPHTLAIESFWRTPNANNWRYMADIYIDYSAQRVLIGNASTLAECTTLREVQIPSAWSDSKITVSVNQGGFADEATAYLYVFDATGAANSSGYEITFGDEGDPSPAPPTLSNVTISGVNF